MIKNINRALYQSFPYHLVQQSPWPIFISFSLLASAIGAVMSMQGYNYGVELLLIGLLLVISSMTLWLRDVIVEGTFLGDHTKEVKAGLMLGMILFIISELFAFLSIFWAYFHSSLSPNVEIGGSWPPIGIEALDPFAIPLLNTFLLLSSGAYVTYGHHGLIKGDRKAAIIGTALTVFLALLFTALQGYEYLGAGFTIADSIYGSTFFASTGLHGFHVIVGTIFIMVGLLRILLYHFTDTHHQGHEAGIFYWHFVDVVWLFLFLSVYYWGGA